MNTDGPLKVKQVGPQRFVDWIKVLFSAESRVHSDLECKGDSAGSLVAKRI